MRRIRQHGQSRWRYAERRSRRIRSRDGRVPPEPRLFRSDVSVFERQLSEHVRELALHDGLLLRKLRAHLSGIRRVHAGLLERPMSDLLRRRNVQRRLFQRPLQHVMPHGRDLHGRLLGRRMRPCVCCGIDLLVHELSGWVLHVHGSRLSVDG